MRQKAQPTDQQVMSFLNLLLEIEKKPNSREIELTKKSQILNRLREIDFPNYSYVNRVLVNQKFIDVKEGHLVWISKVKPNVFMIQEIVKQVRRLRRKDNRKSKAKTTQANELEQTLLDCLVKIQSSNDKGSYFTYEKGSLQTMLKHARLPNYIEIDRVLRHKRYVKNRAFGRARSEYEWIYRTQPTLSIVKSILKKAGVADVNLVKQDIQPKAHIENDFEKPVKQELFTNSLQDKLSGKLTNETLIKLYKKIESIDKQLSELNDQKIKYLETIKTILELENE